MEEEVPASKRVLSKREMFVHAIKDNTPGLVYLKISTNCKSLLTMKYEHYTLHNMVDIYTLRKRLMQIKDLQKANFATLYGNLFSEYNLGDENDLKFSSNFENGNLLSAIKVNYGDE